MDSLNLAKIKFPGKKNNLDVLCERFNIDNSRRDKHGALLDAELLAEVYLCLTQEEQSQFFENKEEIQQMIDMETLLQSINHNQKLPCRNFKITEDEEKEHASFVEKNIKNSIWNLNK